MSIRRALLLSAAFSGSLLAAGTAIAAPPSGAAPTTAAADATGDNSNGQVLITAEKRVASVQRVPIAVSAFTSKSREVIGIDTLNDLTNFTPGLRYAPALDRIFLRGVGRQTNNLATDPGVATYVDGVYNSQTYTAGGDNLFIQRIEVLRGPQGTLYGRNGIGGAINAISATPTQSFYGEARASVGNYGASAAEAVVSGPINDAVRIRLGASYSNQTQGYFHNVATGGTSDGNGTGVYLEGQIAADLGPHVEAWVKASTYWFDTTYGETNTTVPYLFQFLQFDPLAPGSPNAAFAYQGTEPFSQVNPSITGNPGIANKLNFSNNTPSKITQTGNYFLVGHLTWHAPGVDVKYIGGAAHYRLDLWGDADGTDITSITIPLMGVNACSGIAGCGPVTYNPSLVSHYVEDKSFYSHELDLVSTYDGPLQWVAGLYYYHENYTQPVTVSAPGFPGITAPFNPSFINFPTFTGTAAAPNPGGYVSAMNQNMHADSYAGFAQLDWKITPTLKLTGGLRYTYDDKAGYETYRNICWGCSGLEAFGVNVTQQNLGTSTPVLDVTNEVISFAPTPGAGIATLNPTTGAYMRTLSAHWSALTGTAGVEWTPDADTLLFAKYSRGYKSGGFNSGSIVPIPEVAPEYLDDYEAGIKKTMFDHKLSVDAAIFYYNYTGMQIELGQPGASGNVQFNLANLGQVHDWGFELESTWQATDNLQFTVAYAYLNTQIASKTCLEDVSRLGTTDSPGCTGGVGGMGIFNIKGDNLIDAPPNKVALNANYTFHFAPGTLTLSASDTWTDYHYSSVFSNSNYYTPGYNDLGLRALWNDVNNRYTIIVYGKNVLNAVEYDYIYPFPTRTVALQTPVTYGVQLQVRFH